MDVPPLSTNSTHLTYPPGADEDDDVQQKKNDQPKQEWEKQADYVYRFASRHVFSRYGQLVKSGKVYVPTPDKCKFEDMLMMPDDSEEMKRQQEHLLKNLPPGTKVRYQVSD